MKIKMNIPRYLMASGAVFAFTFVLYFIAHGHLMEPLYKATAHLWRSEIEMQSGRYCVWAISNQIATSFAITLLFIANYEKKGWEEGLRFGLMIGAVLALMQTMSYAWMPVPVSIPLSWGLIELIHGIGAGIVASLVYKK